MPRRRESLSEFNIWPAFTDAMGGLVMVLIFLIILFVISEVLIGREMLGKESAINQLQRIVTHLEGLAGDAEKEAARLRGQMKGLQTTVSEREVLLAQLRDELTAVQAARAALDADKRKAEQTTTSVQEQAALLSARAERLAAELEELGGEGGELLAQALDEGGVFGFDPREPFRIRLDAVMNLQSAPVLLVATLLVVPLGVRNADGGGGVVHLEAEAVENDVASVDGARSLA